MGRYLDVREKAVRNLVKQKETLKNMGRKHAYRRNIEKRPTLEENLHKWILEQRKVGRSVSIVKIRLQAKLMAKDTDIQDFKGSVNWACRFMCRVPSRTDTQK